mmetsp:Transcript_58938/g.170981  ORF Transcript_58938/g.170981 Transcript_58938/m.170981 type:complete len:326 (+) Transcript_58938:463-1440(+)
MESGRALGAPLPRTPMRRLRASQKARMQAEVPPMANPCRRHRPLSTLRPLPSSPDSRQTQHPTRRSRHHPAALAAACQRWELPTIWISAPAGAKSLSRLTSGASHLKQRPNRPLPLSSPRFCLRKPQAWRRRLWPRPVTELPPRHRPRPRSTISGTTMTSGVRPQRPRPPASVWPPSARRRYCQRPRRRLRSRPRWRFRRKTPRSTQTSGRRRPRSPPPRCPLCLRRHQVFPWSIPSQTWTSTGATRRMSRLPARCLLAKRRRVQALLAQPAKVLRTRESRRGAESTARSTTKKRKARRRPRKMRERSEKWRRWRRKTRKKVPSE